MWLIISLLGIITFLFWYLSAPFYWRKRNIPHLTPLSIFSNFLPLLTKGLTDFNESLYKHFPGQPFYGFYYFTRPTLFVKDPELIQKILITDFEYFSSHGIYGNQDRDPFGGNLFLIYGQQWKEMRGKLSQYFTPAKVKFMLSYVDKTLSKAMKTIDDSAAVNKPVEVKYILMNITTDVITQAIFGIESDIFQNKDSVFSEIAEQMLKKLSSRFFLGIISPKLFDFLNLCILDKKSSATLIDIVKKTVEYRRKENIHVQDYLQGMIELLDNYTDSGQIYFPDHSRVPRYDLNTLICQALLLFAAGIGSSTATMTFFLYEMATHPEIQEKCREEINNITKETGQEINVGDLSKLIYLTAALQETLRMHTPLSMINRECTKNYTIPGSNVVIEKGTFIYMSAVGTHMDSKYFPEPNISFRPERFMNGSEIKNGTYLPFGIGPRTCLGMSLAYEEMKLVLARFLQHYEFSVCSKTDIPVKLGKNDFLKTPANGMWLGVRRVKSVD